MSNEGKAFQIKNAYERVFGLEKGTSNIAVVEKVFNNLATNFNVLSFETEEDKKFRLQNITDAYDSEGVANYINRISSDLFEDPTIPIYEKFFYLCKISEGKQSDVSKVDNTPDTNVVNNSFINEDLNPYIKDENYEYHSDKDISSKETVDIDNNQFKGGNNNMSTETKDNVKDLKEQADAMNQLREEAAKKAKGDIVDNSNVDLAIDAEAVKNYMNADINNRTNYSRNGKVVQIVVTGFSKTSKAVAGEKAVGYIKDPQAAWNTFAKNSGYNTDKDGNPTFSKLADGYSHAEAMKIHDLLKAAMETEKLEVEPYMGKTPDKVDYTISGFKIKTPEGGEEIKSIKDIPDLLFFKTLGVLGINSSVENAQIQLSSARKKKNGEEPKKAYTVTIYNKKSVLDDKSVVVRGKVLNTSIHQEAPGFKSNVELKYKSDTKTVIKDGVTVAKELTWRIPLQVDQFQVDEVDEYKDLYSKKGVSGEFYNIEDDQDLKKLEDSNNIIFVKELNNKDSKLITADIRQEIQKEKEKIIAKRTETNKQIAGGGETVSEADLA